MSKSSKCKSLEKGASWWAIGASIFAMFFGAGNIIFPLNLGIENFTHPSMASLGFIITAVIVPCLGLIAIILYSGDYKSFFYTIGKTPGFVLITLILGLIGPFAGIPRAIIVSYGTLVGLKIPLCFIEKNLIIFSLLSCGLIFVFSSRLGKLLQWLGLFFSPVMLLTLAVIIIKSSMISANSLEAIGTEDSWKSFQNGFLVGFSTMDLLASFFFSAIVLVSLKKIAYPNKDLAELESACFCISKKTTALLLKGSLFAALLLTISYFSFIFSSARHSASLANVNITNILGYLSSITLGPKINWITGLCVFFACLSTEIALAGIFADFLHTVLFPNYLKYSSSLIITLIIAFFISIINFDGLTAILVPILEICYPALIVLTIINILKKTVNFPYVKSCFYGILVLTFVLKYLI